MQAAKELDVYDTIWGVWGRDNENTVKGLNSLPCQRI
jgi:hypothetical protein